MSWTPFIFPLVLAVVFAVGVFVKMRQMKRRPMMAQPRAIRRQQRKMLWFLVPVFLLQEYVAFKMHSMAGMIFFGIAIVVNIAIALRDPTRSEEITNWRMDNSKCGRCEYDLTGNVSRVCPECGWNLPSDEVRIETKGWVAFWRKWRIDYLENWRKTLLALVGSVAFSGLCLAYILWLGMWPFTVIIGALLAMGAIQVVRVVQYGMRVSKEEKAQNGTFCAGTPGSSEYLRPGVGEEK